MPDRRGLHHRRSIRLAGFDYAAPGSYFITICTAGRECIFGEVVDDVMRPGPCGKVAIDVWQTIPAHFTNVRLDAFVAMPNHVYGIITIEGPMAEVRDVGATHASPLRRPHGPKKGSIAAVVAAYKSTVTRRINTMRRTPGEPVWQRNYGACPERSRREHIVRDEDDSATRARRFAAAYASPFAIERAFSAR